MGEQETKINDETAAEETREEDLSAKDFFKKNRKARIQLKYDNLLATVYDDRVKIKKALSENLAREAELFKQAEEEIQELNSI